MFLCLSLPVTRVEMKLTGNMGPYGRAHLLAQVFMLVKRTQLLLKGAASKIPPQGRPSGRRKERWEGAEFPGP